MLNDAVGEKSGSMQPHLVESRGNRRRTSVLAACLIATFMVAVESTIVAAIIPTNVSDLGAFNVFT